MLNRVKALTENSFKNHLSQTKNFKVSKKWTFAAAGTPER